MNYDKDKHRADIKIDFLLSLESKITLVEVKSTENYRCLSLQRFSEKYKRCIGDRYILHPKNLSIKEDGVIYLPLYMACFL